jgi:hypothetical protein
MKNLRLLNAEPSSSPVLRTRKAGLPDRNRDATVAATAEDRPGIFATIPAGAQLAG